MADSALGENTMRTSPAEAAKWKQLVSHQRQQLYAMQRLIASYCKLLGIPILNPAVTGWTSRRQRNNKADEEHQKLGIYEQAVHCKTIFFTLIINMTGLKLTITMNEILSATLNDANAETAMYCAMVAPHP